MVFNSKVYTPRQARNPKESNPRRKFGRVGLGRTFGPRPRWFSLQFPLTSSNYLTLTDIQYSFERCTAHYLLITYQTRTADVSGYT